MTDRVSTADEAVIVRELRRRLAGTEEANACLREAVAVRDDFIAIAAHELRNPMMPIMGRVALLRRLVGNPGTLPEDIAAKLREIEWLIILFVKRANTLLDVSRMTSGHLQLDLVAVDVCRLATLVVENFGPLAQHTGATLALQLPSEPLFVVGDALAIEQVLDNLVSNAIKYGDANPITLRIGSDLDTGMASVSVSDGGPGISSDARARIFERFERAVRPGQAPGGFGVGLWIARRFIEAMGGSIDVICPPGGGSIFTVALQLAKDHNG